MHDFVKNHKKAEIGILFVPNTDFAVETDGTRMERRACVFDNIFRIDGFACPMPFDHFCTVCIYRFREFVNDIFIDRLGGNQVHRTHVHTCEWLRLSFIGICGDSDRVKEGILLKKRLFRCFVKRDEKDVLRRAGSRDGWCRDRTAHECCGSRAIC